MSHDLELDLDSPWKEILEQCFTEFMAFFFPDIHAVIDWAAGYEFLDKELQQIAREGDTGRRIVDKLVKVRLKTHEDMRLYIHVEVQGQYEAHFAERMFVYYYRLYDRHPRRVISLAVLSDARTKWRPKSYRHRQLKCGVDFFFPTVKLLDYRKRWAELEQDRNPFAIVVRAHLKAIETRRKPLDRLHWKIELVKALYDAGYDRQYVLNLLRFIDWVMVLPKELEIRFDEEIKFYEEDKKMPYIMSFERRAIEKGIEKGREEGMEKGREEGMEKGVELGALQTAREGILDILQLRFNKVSKALADRINAIGDLQILRQLHKHSVTVASLAEFRRLMDAVRPAKASAN